MGGRGRGRMGANCRVLLLAGVAVLAEGAPWCRRAVISKSVCGLPEIFAACVLVDLVLLCHFAVLLLYEHDFGCFSVGRVWGEFARVLLVNGVALQAHKLLSPPGTPLLRPLAIWAEDTHCGQIGYISHRL